MKIGKVYANAEHEEDRADQTLIEMGAIAGDGLLGAVVEAVNELCDATADCAYYGESSPEGIVAIEGIAIAWLKLFVALKAIEETQGDGDSMPADILQCQGCGKPSSSLTTWTIEDDEDKKVVWLCSSCQGTRMNQLAYIEEDRE